MLPLTKMTLQDHVMRLKCAPTGVSASTIRDHITFAPQCILSLTSFDIDRQTPQFTSNLDPGRYWALVALEEEQQAAG